MTETNQPMPTIPFRMANLPRDHRGFPVPWFVLWHADNGEPLPDGQGRPDFRVIGPGKLKLALTRGLCWVCGQPLGSRKAFVIGPMCAVNRVTSEPPCHRDCAIFSATACPFLSRPRMRRNEKDLPDGHKKPAGIHIDRNPGCACVWIVGQTDFQIVRLQREPGIEAGIMFRLGKPKEVLWFALGRAAKRSEVIESIDSGYPLLAEAANLDGVKAVLELNQMKQDAMKLLPAA